MTQLQLAEALGISKRTQANYESGSSDATASYLSNVSVQFNFDVPYILTGRRTTLALDSLNELEDRIVQQYRSIPEDDQRAIRRFVKALADDVVKGSI
ncbi:helix-turn-helix domain-containing protein [Pseudomonas orientalis]|uniref:helix-turn-helix domain-containing protein n=2 Tax=Pseudomonas TaxID=286 RepID=UPI002FDF7163